MLCLFVYDVYACAAGGVCSRLRGQDIVEQCKISLSNASTLMRQALKWLGGVEEEVLLKTQLLRPSVFL